MRRSVILFFLLCLSFGAFAMLRAFHLRVRLEAVLRPDISTASTHPALAALDTSPAKAPSEQSSAKQPNGTQTPASNDNATSPSNGVKLDLAEISSTGATSVFAGRAQPGATVTVFENGVAVASATANGNGDWSIATDHKFAGPDPKFTLSAGFGKPPKTLDEIAANSSESAPASGEAANRPASPTAELLRNFEKTVASAREEEARKVPSGPNAAEVDPLPPAAPGAAPTVTASSAPPAALKDDTHLQSATIPVPMTFVFDEATLTPDGAKTAKLLLDYLLLKKFASVTLSGHADERGTAEYNMDLSRKRLDAVSAFLRGGGYQGKLDLVPKGATEPFTGIDRSKYSQDDLMQLDRRVELRNAM